MTESQTSPLYRAIFSILLAVVFSAGAAFSQQDSTKIPAGLLVKPVFFFGAVTTNPNYSISDSGIAWNDYTFAGEVLQKIPGSFLANMYQPGDPSEISFDGLGGNFVGYTLDGVSLSDPTTSALNLYHVPMEFMNRVDYIDAVRSPIYEFNATGALVNFQSQSYSEQQPYSKVRHLEEPYNYLVTDGVFSQNIGFNSNIDVGFERQTTDGRFYNSVYDGVNIRAKYRYSIDSTREITATEIFYRTKGGMTGGAMPYVIDASTFDQVFIKLRSQYADLTYLQHHLRLAYSQTDPADSENYAALTTYYDYYNFLFGDASLPYSFVNYSSKVGVDLRASHVDPFGRVNFGGEAERDENTYNSSSPIPPMNRVSAYADQEFRLFNLFEGGIFGRGDVTSSQVYPSYGASIGIRADDFEIRLGGSISKHFPSQSEKFFVTQNFVGNPLLRPETHHIIKLTVSAFAGENLEFSISPYMRSITDPIFFRETYNGQPAYPQIAAVNLSSRDISGVDVSASVNFWKIFADGNFNYTYQKVDGNQSLLLPKYFISGEVYLHEILFENHLNLKIGIRGKALSVFQGSEFYPQALIYYPAELNELGPFGNSDIFLQAKVGDAIFYLTFFNVGGQDYILAPVYPALDRSFGFGVDWNFLN